MNINKQIDYSAILQLLIGLAGFMVTLLGLFLPSAVYFGKVSNFFYGGTEVWFIGMLIVGIVFLFLHKYKGVLFVGLCVLLLFLKVISPLWIYPEMVSLKWGVGVVAFGLLLIFWSAFYHRRENQEIAPVCLKANYIWPLFAGVAYIALLFAISFTGEGAPYLFSYVNLPFIKFFELEAALRVPWIPILFPVVGFVFYYLGALAVSSIYRGVSEPLLARIWGSFLGFVIFINLSPSITAKIHTTIISSQASNLNFPDASDSDACRNNIVYVRMIPGGSEIWSMDEFGRNNINLSSKYTSRGAHRTFDSGPHWSPDGKKILFSAVRNEAPGVYLMSCDGSIQYMVARTGTNNNYPAWAPDSEQIVYSDMVSGLTLVDYTGKRNKLLLRGRILTAVFSPEGKEIAYVNIVGTHVSNIELLNVESGKRKVLVADGNNNIWPKWLSKTLLSYATDLGKHKLYPPIKYEEKAPYIPRYYSLSENASYEIFPDSVSTSGNLLTVVSKEIENKKQIVVMDAGGKIIRQLTFEGWNESPDLKPGTILENKPI